MSKHNLFKTSIYQFHEISQIDVFKLRLATKINKHRIFVSNGFPIVNCNLQLMLIIQIISNLTLGGEKDNIKGAQKILHTFLMVTLEVSLENRQE